MTFSLGIVISGEQIQPTHNVLYNYSIQHFTANILVCNSLVLLVVVTTFSRVKNV